jgi:hypothetical protein
MVVHLVFVIVGIRCVRSQVMAYARRDGEMHMSIGGSWTWSDLEHHRGFVSLSKVMLGRSGLD